MSARALNWAWQQEVDDPHAKLILLKLADQTNDDGECWPSRKTISQACRIGMSTVTRKIAEMEAAGLITRTERSRENGGRSSNLYTLSLESDPLLAPSRPPARQVSRHEPSVEPGPEYELPTSSEKVNSSPLSSAAKAANGADSKSEDVEIVYRCWRTERGKTHPRYEVISPGRRAKIKARLREFTSDELCAAIRAVAHDPWPERARHDDITVLLRSREQVDRFLGMVIPDTQPTRNGLSQATLDALAAGAELDRRRGWT